jgi:hypothetical protein
MYATALACPRNQLISRTTFAALDSVWNIEVMFVGDGLAPAACVGASSC